MKVRKETIELHRTDPSLLFHLIYASLIIEYNFQYNLSRGFEVLKFLKIYRINDLEL